MDTSKEDPEMGRQDIADSTSATLELVLDKMMTAFDECRGLLLNPSEVVTLAYERVNNFAPGTQHEHSECYRLILDRAKNIRGTGGSMLLSDIEVEAYITVLNRMSLYQPNFGKKKWSAETRYLNWLRSYAHYSLNGSHVLDHKRDLTKDYSKAHEKLEGQGWKALLNKLTPPEIEDMAEQDFFCAVAGVERLEHARSAKTGAKFSRGEVAGLLAAKALATGLQEFQKPSASMRRPQETAFQKLYDTCTGKEASLTAEEVDHFLKLCQHIPRPKPCPDPRISVEKKSNNSSSVSKEGEGASIHSANSEAPLDKIRTKIQDLYSELDKHMADPSVITLDRNDTNRIGVLETLMELKEKILLDGFDEPFHSRTSTMQRLMKRLDDIVKSVDQVVQNLSGFEEWFVNIDERNSVARLSVVATAIKDIQRALDKSLKDRASLRKMIETKDKKLQEAEGAVTKARDLRGAREDKLNLENQKLESDLRMTKLELEKALRVPEKIREEFFNKVQKLHEKANSLEKKLTEETQAHEILRLDQEATNKELQSSRAKVDRHKDALKRFQDEYVKVKSERDQLKGERYQLKSSPDRDIKAALQSQEKQTEKALSQVAKLTEDNDRLEEDICSMRSMRDSGEETIRELLQHQAHLQECLAEMEEIQNATLDKLEKERKNVRAMEKDEAVKELEKRLAEERAKSKRLEELLGPVLAAAAAVTSL